MFLFSLQFKAKGRVYRSMVYEPKALQKMNSKVRDKHATTVIFLLSFELILAFSSPVLSFVHFYISYCKSNVIQPVAARFLINKLSIYLVKYIV